MITFLTFNLRCNGPKNFLAHKWIEHQQPVEKAIKDTELKSAQIVCSESMLQTGPGQSLACRALGGKIKIT